MPLTFGSAMKRACDAMKAAGIEQKEPTDLTVLSDMTSKWSTRIFVSLPDGTTSVPNATVTNLSGTYVSKLYEGPYSNFGSWIQDLQDHIKTTHGEDLDPCEILAFYTTCPGCAKTYGKNYTILFAPLRAA